MPWSIKGIIYMRYRIPINNGISVKTFVVYVNSQSPGFLIYIQDGVTILGYNGLYPALIHLFFQVLWGFLQLLFTQSLLTVARYRLCRVYQLKLVLDV